MTALTLLVTRPRLQCGAWLARLAELGVDAAALPLIEILPARDASPVIAAWAALPAVDLAVFVSPNAVEQFFAGAAVAAGTWPAETLAACVGPGSAQALADHGVPVAQIVQPAADAASLDSEHLWEQLSPMRAWAGARVLLLRGDGGRDVVGRALGRRRRERRSGHCPITAPARGSTPTSRPCWRRPFLIPSDLYGYSAAPRQLATCAACNWPASVPLPPIPALLTPRAPQVSSLWFWRDRPLKR